MTDYIKREDAKKWLTNLREDCGRYQDLWHYAEALDQIIDSLDTDVALVRHGHWVKISPAGIYECSECGKNVMTSDIEAYERCHGCGAIMDGEYENCDTCKHHDKGWDDIICDGCTKAHSNWERKDDEIIRHG